MGEYWGGDKCYEQSTLMEVRQSASLLYSLVSHLFPSSSIKVCVSKSKLHVLCRGSWHLSRTSLSAVQSPSNLTCPGTISRLHRPPGHPPAGAGEINTLFPSGLPPVCDGHRATFPVHVPRCGPWLVGSILPSESTHIHTPFDHSFRSGRKLTGVGPALDS